MKLKNLERNRLFLKTKDYSVSQEEFELWYNVAYDMLITHPQPSLENLSKYYENANYISHTDSKKTLFEKMYQFVKQIALKNKLKLINSLSKKGKILDIGAGVGDFLATLQKDGWQTIGYEPSPNARTIAKQKGISFVDSFSEIENHSLDVITMWHVLEHVPNLEEQILELKRMLKKDGTLIVAVPNYKSLDAQTYQDYWAAYDVPIHFWHFSKRSIELIFSEFNMELVNVLPMKFDSFYVSMLSEKYKNGKINYLKSISNGLKSNRYGNRENEYSSHIYILKNQ